MAFITYLSYKCLFPITAALCLALPCSVHAALVLAPSCLSLAEGYSRSALHTVPFFSTTPRPAPSLVNARDFCTRFPTAHRVVSVHAR